MKVVITGDGLWSDREVIEFALRMFPEISEVVEGECEGADIMARDVADALGLKVHRHPAPWGKLGLEAGPWRNGQMLALHPDIKVALVFHNDLRRSTGTIDMVRKLRKRTSVNVWQFRRVAGVIKAFHIQVAKERSRFRP